MGIGRLVRRVLPGKGVKVALGEPFQNLPHVGTLWDGRRVYSSMTIRTSTPDEIVLANGSRIASSESGGFSLDIVGGPVLLRELDDSVSTYVNSSVTY